MKNQTLAKPGSDAGIRRILEAACTAFATRGFDGASLRAISSEAGVLHTAMLYHFKTKDALWRAVMSELFDDFNGRIDRRTEELKGATMDALARQLIRVFIHFCAERPELHRIMTIEGRSDTPRLAWLYDNHTKRLFATVKAMQSTADQTVFDDPARLYYVIVGLAASTFTLAPEYKRLSGRDPFSAEEVEATARLVERILFGPPTS